MKLFELFSICYSQQPNIKLQDRFISLEAYGFGSTDNGPHEYYFEINLFESINIEVNINCNCHLSVCTINVVMNLALFMNGDFTTAVITLCFFLLDVVR